MDNLRILRHQLFHFPCCPRLQKRFLRFLSFLSPQENKNKRQKSQGKRSHSDPATVSDRSVSGVMCGHFQHLGGRLVGEDDLPVDRFHGDNLSPGVGPRLVDHLCPKASGRVVVVGRD